MNRYNIIHNIYFVYKIKKCFIKSPRAVSMSLFRRFIHFIRSVKIAMLENISIYIAKAFVALRNSRCSAKREREIVWAKEWEYTDFLHADYTQLSAKIEQDFWWSTPKCIWQNVCVVSFLLVVHLLGIASTMKYVPLFLLCHTKIKCYLILSMHWTLLFHTQSLLFFLRISLASAYAYRLPCA